MKNIPYISPYANGWKLSERKEVIPVWFTGHQFPPSVSRSKETHRKTLEKNDAYDADDSDADIGKDSGAPKKVKRKKSSHEKNSDGTTPGRKYRKNLTNMIVRGEVEDEFPSGDDQELHKTASTVLLLPPAQEKISSNDEDVSNAELIFNPVPVESMVLSDNSGYHGTLTEEEASEEMNETDGWEHFSDFEITESSGSDWM